MQFNTNGREQKCRTFCRQKGMFWYKDILVKKLHDLTLMECRVTGRGNTFLRKIYKKWSTLWAKDKCSFNC